MNEVGRDIKCKKCHFAGVIEACDTQQYPLQKIFRHLGKDPKGYLHFQCPACGADEAYSPFMFLDKSSRMSVYVAFAKLYGKIAAALLIVGFVIWIIVRAFM